MKMPGKPRRLGALLLGGTLALMCALAGGWPAARGHRDRADVRSLLAIGLFGPALAAKSPLVPDPGVLSALFGVYCTSPANCWAVGTYEPTATTGRNEMLHWNGSRWTRVFVPNPAGTANNDENELSAVRCVRATDCWAVGLYQRFPGPILTQAYHWKGRRWRSVAVPEAGGTAAIDITALTDVVCPSSASCWAVGIFGNQGSNLVVRNYALHWNGKRWTPARTPEPAGTATDDVNEIVRVRCTSGTNCLAVGSDGAFGSRDIMVNQVLRWNGRTWSAVSVPNPGGTGASGDFSQLNGLACSSAANCWAVGTYSPTASVTRFNQMLHWNGSAWTQVDVPEPGGTTDGASQELLFAACGSPINCWAVGDFAPAGSTQVSANQAMHWDGGVWSAVDTPDPGGVSSGDTNRLAALRCVSATSCWAVGVASLSGGSDFGQALHWDGTRWSVR